jgi:hypothetical protein
MLAGIVAGGFAYGVALERTRAFPYNLVKTVYLSARSALRPSGPIPRGRWHRYEVRDQTRDLTEEQLAEIERLETMAYLSGSRPATERAGVALHDPERAQRGLNLVVSGHAAWAGLMDMSGNVLHEWRREFRDVWPDNPISDDAVGTHHWHHVHLYENGDILAVFQGVGLIKIDRDSNLLWDRPGGYHHDLKVVDDGSIYILDQKAHIVPRWDPESPVLENFVTVLDSEGHVRSRASLLAAFENSPYSPTLTWAPTIGDPFHSNSIQLLDGTLSDRTPAFEEGNVLVSIRELDTIAVVDLDAESVVWAASGQWRRQHDATLLPTGRILLFDNWHATGVSEVLEFDPLTQTVEWSYAGSEGRPFYSETVGTNQRLPNGNTLIVESDNGRAFEVTTGGEIVWEYVSPYRAGEQDELIATLFDVVRLPADFPTEWARGADRADPAARRSPEAGGG